MATQDHQSVHDHADSSKEAGTSSSGLKAVESDSDLRRKSLPPRIFAPNRELSVMDDTPRSCSANGTYSQGAPTMVSLPIETKAAFEDNFPLSESQAVVKAKSGEVFSSSQLDTVNTAHRQATEDLGDMATANAEKVDLDQPLDGKESKTVDTESLQTETGTITIIHVEPSDEPHASEPVPDALFASREPSIERVQYTLRDKRKSLAPSKVTSSDNVAASMLGSQAPSDELNDLNDTEKETNERSNSSELTIENKAGNYQNQRPGKETTNDKEDVSSNDTKTSKDVEEQSDTIQLQAVPAFIQQVDPNKRRRSSTASLQHFPASPPSGLLGTPRARRVSAIGASIFSTPSTSGQADMMPTVRETAMSISPDSPSGSSGMSESRRGSQTRRKSSVAASMLNSDSRDGKKGSIGFTVAASLVKWKLNTLKAARKASETIAKDAKHQEFMDKTADRIKTELPRPLLVSIQEEAYPIILRTAQAYKSQLGVKHKLTMQAYNRLADLARDLKNPY